MKKTKYGVHKEHCCIKHGCKYGNKDCPVVLGEIIQSYLCESCDFDGIESVEQLMKGEEISMKKLINDLKLSGIQINDIRADKCYYVDENNADIEYEHNEITSSIWDLACESLDLNNEYMSGIILVGNEWKKEINIDETGETVYRDLI